MASILSVMGRTYNNQFKCNDQKKLQMFSQFFTAILKSTFNFEHFEKKRDPHSVCIS